MMPAILTEEEFSRHLNTKFHAGLEDGGFVDLELVQVKSYRTSQNEQNGLERFSAFFRGPTEPNLPQKIYPLKHDPMGEFEIFLVPIACDDLGFRYEAVFNYFK